MMVPKRSWRFGDPSGLVSRSASSSKVFNWVVLGDPLALPIGLVRPPARPSRLDAAERTGDQVSRVVGHRREPHGPAAVVLRSWSMRRGVNEGHELAGAECSWRKRPARRGAAYGGFNPTRSCRPGNGDGLLRKGDEVHPV